MKRAAAKEKTRSSGPARSYLQTRVRASRLYEAAFILAIVELSRRLHQAYRQAYDKQAADWLLPQNSAAPIDPQAIRKYLEGILRNGDCGTFVQDLINKVSDNTRTPFKSDYLLDLFDLIAGVTEGGFARAGSTPGLRTDPVSGKSTIELVANWPYPRTSLEQAVINESDAQVTLHELIHFAGMGQAYSGPQLATAAADLLRRTDAPIRKSGESNDDFVKRTSAYFDSRLREKCPSLGIHFSSR